MTISYNADADPDPTTQIAWPARHKQRTASSSQHESQQSSGQTSYQAVQGNGKQNNTSMRQHSSESQRTRLSTWNLITLSISMAGAQIAWTVELGYVLYAAGPPMFNLPRPTDMEHLFFCPWGYQSRLPA
jgi:solute carrier family 45 protein 1/2/4